MFGGISLPIRRPPFYLGKQSCLYVSMLASDYSVRTQETFMSFTDVPTRAVTQILTIQVNVCRHKVFDTMMKQEFAESSKKEAVGWFCANKIQQPNELITSSSRGYLRSWRGEWIWSFITKLEQRVQWRWYYDHSWVPRLHMCTFIVCGDSTPSDLVEQWNQVRRMASKIHLWKQSLLWKTLQTDVLALSRSMFRRFAACPWHPHLWWEVRKNPLVIDCDIFIRTTWMMAIHGWTNIRR